MTDLELHEIALVGGSGWFIPTVIGAGVIKYEKEITDFIEGVFEGAIRAQERH